MLCSMTTKLSVQHNCFKISDFLKGKNRLVFASFVITQNSELTKIWESTSLQ